MNPSAPMAGPPQGEDESSSRQPNPATAPRRRQSSFGSLLLVGYLPLSASSFLNKRRNPANYLTRDRPRRVRQPRHRRGRTLDPKRVGRTLKLRRNTPSKTP